jgi:hypothetical protein
MTKIVWLAIALTLLAGITIITNAYACGDVECEGHSEGECSHHDKCEGHPEGECSGHAEGEEHAKGKCSGHGEGEGHAKGERHGMMKNLSDEQRAAVHAKIKAMRAEGATHAQIRVAVKEMLKEAAEARVQATEEKPAASLDVQKGNGNGRSWVTKAVFAVGHTFKAVAGAVVGIFS